MKKATKQALIWSGVALGAGGIATGIAVPIALDHAKRSDISPTRLTGDEHIWANGPTINELMNKDKDSIDVKNLDLLKSSEHQLAFYLYEKEQEGSLKLQSAFFTWHKNEIVSSLEKFYKNTLHKTDFTSTNDVDADYTNLSSKIQTTINAITDANDKKTQQDRFKTFTEDWNTNNNKINSIKNNSINYSEERFNDKYPKVLMPLSTIKSKHQKVYDDQKHAFVSQAADKPSGEKEWFAGLSSRFNGATTEAEAVDSKVFAEIQNKAYARFQYSIDSSFTYKQYKSGIFKDFLGNFTSDPTAAKTNGIGIKATSQDDDKIFFFASKSNIAEWLNPIPGNKLQLNDLQHLTRTNNAILGFKQDKADVDAPWTADKGMLVKLFSGFMEHTTTSTGGTTTTTSKATSAYSVWSNIFTTGEEDLTKRLVQSYSLTTDSTQSRSGDLGVSTSLDNMQMVPGFALGTLSIMHDLKSSTNPKVITSANFLTKLFTSLRDELVKWMKANGFTPSTLLETGTDASLTPVQLEKYNKHIANIINTEMSDSDIKKVFGKTIKDAFNALDSAHDGIPLAIKLHDDVYIVVSEEYGVHVIKFREEGSNLIDLLKEDLTKAAEKQNTSEISTNYASLFVKNLTTYGKMAKLLNIPSTGTPTIQNTALLDYLWDHKDRLKTESTTKAELNTEIATLVDRLMKSEYISKVDAAAKDALAKWLNGKLDQDLILDQTSTIKPEEIYNEIFKAGGGA